jgi:hypothetical protein
MSVGIPIARKVAEQFVRKFGTEVGQGVYVEKGKEILTDVSKKSAKRMESFADENKENVRIASNKIKEPLSLKTYGRWNENAHVSPNTPPKYIGGQTTRKTKSKKVMKKNGKTKSKKVMKRKTMKKR